MSNNKKEELSKNDRTIHEPRMPCESSRINCFSFYLSYLNVEIGKKRSGSDIKSGE